jgi:glucose dehydrogenase
VRRNSSDQLLCRIQFKSMRNDGLFTVRSTDLC